MKNKKAIRPRSFSENELAKVGVEIRDLSSGILGGLECGKGWGVNQPPRGSYRSRGYWKYPNECNEFK